MPGADERSSPGIGAGRSPNLELLVDERLDECVDAACVATVDSDEVVDQLGQVDGRDRGVPVLENRGYLVSDNNFAPAQFTQFLLFAVSPG